MVLMLVMLAISIILDFISFITSGVNAGVIVRTIFQIIIAIYFFIVVLSLYAKIKIDRIQPNRPTAPGWQAT